MIKGFRDFIARGNVVDLSVGVIIGAAFGKVVSAVVDNVLNPLIAGIFGQPDFSKMFIITIGSGDDASQIQLGSLLTAVINFLIVAVAIYFFIVVPINKLKDFGKKDDDKDALAAATQAETTNATDARPSDAADASAKDEQVELLTEIRDLLKNK